MYHSLPNLSYSTPSEGFDKIAAHPDGQRILAVAARCAWVILGGLTLFFIGRLFLMQDWAQGLQIISTTLTSTIFWSAVLVGFLAQVVDGALGMAYGITATTFLLSLGISPALASASVHIAEIFTCGFSGITHVRCGNVRTSLFVRLLVPGMIGGVVGAVVVTRFNGALLTPFISVYLVFMGLFILWKALGRQPLRMFPLKHVGKLALFGGFVDAVGGGGWGPVVTTTLLGSGHEPRHTIGSVNFAEFFLTLASAASFSLLVQTNIWPIVGGLVIGGLCAAPWAALVCKYLRPRLLLILVGTLITVISLYKLYRILV